MNFDRIARAYRALETIAFGNALQRARTEFLPEVTGRRRALLVGEGNGRFLIELLKSNAGIAIDYVDSSARMLEIAQNRFRTTPAVNRSRDHRVRFHHADVRQWQPQSSGYDLIVTHFFLDCFDGEQLGSVIHKIGATAGARATWLVSDFQMPERGASEVHAKIWLRAMYLFFAAVTNLDAKELVPPASLLRDANFALRKRKDFRSGLISAQLWERVTPGGPYASV